MSRKILDYKKYLKLRFGQYCQVYKKNISRNSQTARTRNTISLGPSENIQKNYQFITLNTDKKIIKRYQKTIPIPDTVIDRVNILGKNQPSQLIFRDRHGRFIGDMGIPEMNTRNNNINNNDDNVNNNTPVVPMDENVNNNIPKIEIENNGTDKLPEVDTEMTNKKNISP